MQNILEYKAYMYMPDRELGTDTLRWSVGIQVYAQKSAYTLVSVRHTCICQVTVKPTRLLKENF